MLLELNEGSNLYKFKDCERWGTVFPEQEAHNADELSVETTIPQTQQETAYQRHCHTDKTSQKSVNKQLKRLNVRPFSLLVLAGQSRTVSAVSYLGWIKACICVPSSGATGASLAMLRKMRKNATMWVNRPKNTTGFLPKRLHLSRIPNTPPPG